MYKAKRLQSFFSSWELCNTGKTTVQVGLVLPGAPNSGTGTLQQTMLPVLINAVKVNAQT